MLIRQVNWKIGPEVVVRLRAKHVLLVQEKRHDSESTEWPEDGSFELKMTKIWPPTRLFDWSILKVLSAISADS